MVRFVLMNDMFLKARKFKIRYRIVGLIAALVLVIGVAFRSTDNYFEISKNLDLYASVVREINTYYVDDIDVGKLNKKAIDEMLKTLDPYTNYISEAEAEDFRFQLTGQYGGIGAQIAQKGDYVVITNPYENYPAQKAGLLAGDIITEIEGKSTKGKSTSDISKMLKGQPGTAIKIGIKRGDEQFSKDITREEIKMKNVPYSGMINSETGYIRLSGFTNDAGKEVRDALVELKKNAGMKQVILDLRGNPGGLLNEAVNVVNVFVPIGQEVVTTKGKVSEWNTKYSTLSQPVDVTMPVVVLTNHGSASASEIVSGTLQDLDRAVIIGQRTFGKGLVQSTRPLNYNAQIKITTAKYYIPSGRFIQALDYSHRNEDGSVGNVPDSLKKAFKTRNGRTVYDGGGIEPDIHVKEKTASKIAESLVAKQLIFDFATRYRQQHASIGSIGTFQVDDRLFDEFKNFLSDKEYGYTTDSEKALEEFKQKADDEKYFEAVKAEYEAMKKNLNHDKLADLERNKQDIKELLQEEIARRYYFQKAQFETSFQHDADIREALKLFSTPDQFKKIISQH